MENEELEYFGIRFYSKEMWNQIEFFGLDQAGWRKASVTFYGWYSSVDDKIYLRKDEVQNFIYKSSMLEQDYVYSHMADALLLLSDFDGNTINYRVVSRGIEVDPRLFNRPVPCDIMCDSVTLYPVFESTDIHIIEFLK